MAQNASWEVRLYNARQWRDAAVIFVVYVVVYELTALYVPAFVPLYPASAVAFAGLFVGGLRMWPAVFLAALLSLGANHVALPYLIALPIAECLQAAAGASILRRTNIDPLFRRYRDISYFFISVIPAAFILAAARALVAIAIGSPISIASAGTRFTGALASLVIVAPFILRWTAKLRFARTVFEWLETLVVFALLFVLDTAVFIYRLPALFNIPLVYILLLLLFWIALRLRPRFTSLALLGTGVFGIISVFMHPTAQGLVSDMYQMEVFLIVITCIFLIITSVEEDRRLNVNVMRSQVLVLENAMAQITSESSAKNDFIAILAHELRNPLAPIASGIDLLRIKGVRDAEDLEVLSLMEGRMNIVRRLLDDLLDVSRITRGKLSLRRHVVNLEKIVRRSIVSTDHYFKERHQSLVTKFSKLGKYVLGDSVRLEQVFSNLLTNASKYSRSGSTIQLKMAATDGTVRVSIADEGIGIDENELEAIFTPFNQLGGSKKGLGIGLALVRAFVERHGGTVSAKSAGKGKGSIFEVTLPLHHIGERKVSKPKRKGDGFTAARKDTSATRILVVDDNETAAASVGRLLEYHRYRVAYAYNGQQTLEAVARRAPDVVILDVGLPDKDGYEVASELRDAGYRGKLIALSGYSTDDARERGKEAGFDEYLVKPTGLNDLKRVLRK